MPLFPSSRLHLFALTPLIPRSRFERSEIVAVYWGYHRMDMVWHENKCIDIAARPVEVEQAMLDFPAHVRPPQLGGRPYRHPTIPVYGG